MFCYPLGPTFVIVQFVIGSVRSRIRIYWSGLSYCIGVERLETKSVVQQWTTWAVFYLWCKDVQGYLSRIQNHWHVPGYVMRYGLISPVNTSFKHNRSSRSLKHNLGKDNDDDRERSIVSGSVEWTMLLESPSEVSWRSIRRSVSRYQGVCLLFPLRKLISLLFVDFWDQKVKVSKNCWAIRPWFRKFLRKRGSGIHSIFQSILSPRSMIPNLVIQSPIRHGANRCS